MERERDYTQDRLIPSMVIESEGDYVLPDYEGSIRKILHTRSRVEQKGRFKNGDKLESNGVVNHCVVYVNEDNKLESIEFTTDYELSVKCVPEEYVSSIIKPRVLSSSIRLMGPRKLSARTSIGCRIVINERKNYSVDCDEDLADDYEALESSLAVRSTLTDRSDEYEYSETVMKIDGVVEDEIRILLVSVDAVDKNIEENVGRIDAEGNFVVNILYAVGAEPPSLTEFKIPFSHKIDTVDGVDAEDTETIVYINNIEAEALPTDDGSEINVKFTAFSELVRTSTQNVSVLTDGFYKSYECENEYAKVTYPSLVMAKAFEYDFSCIIPKSELDLEEIRNVVFCSADISACDVSNNNDGLKMEGEIKFSGIACQINEDLNLEYAPLKTMSKFCINVNDSGQNKQFDVAEAEVVPGFVETVVVEDSVEFRAKLYCRILLTKNGCVDAVSSYSALGDKLVKEEGIVNVYYPSKDENLFSIAKRFKKSLISIAEANALSQETIAQNSSNNFDKLIIIQD